MFTQMACPHLGRSVRSASFRRGAAPCLTCRILWYETRLFAMQYAAYWNVICRILQDVFLPGGVLAFAFRPDTALPGVCMWLAFSRLSCPCQLSTLMLVLPPYDITSSTR